MLNKTEEEAAQGLTEYALLLLAAALAVFLILQYLGVSLADVYDLIISALPF